MNEEPGLIFEQVVQASVARCAARGTTTISPTSAKALGLLRNPLPVPDETNREWALVDENLRRVLHDLVIGQLPWPFFLTGGPGRGKSAAVLCLADHVQGAVYFRFTRLLKAFEWSRLDRGVILRRWQRRSTDACDDRLVLRHQFFNETDFFNFLIGAPLLVIDDIGTRGGYTEPQYDQFYDIVEERKHRPLILVSNLTLKVLGDVFDERILSRLAVGTRFTLAGHDRRLNSTSGMAQLLAEKKASS